MLKKLVFFTLLISCLFSTNALAKWWIFGQSADEVATRYLYLNDISFNELDEQVTLYTDMLPGGRVVLRGKGQAGKSRIGKVEVSLDNKESWQQADKSDDGSFEFSFIPEPNRTYQLYVKILDTAGKSNAVDETYREISVSNSAINAVIRAALDAMIRAYQDEDPRAFMALVADDFAGDYVILDRAIRKDFTAFDGLNLNYTLNNVASGSQGKVFVAISYNRQVTSARSGETLTDRGLTEFVFTLNAGSAKVLSMKNPLIFGLSEAEEVATGTVNSGENAEVLILDETGGMRLGSVDEIGRDGGGGSSDAAPTNFSVVSFSYPVLQLSFDISAGVTSATHTRILEWSTNPAGPWSLDTDLPMAEASISAFTVHCRGEIWDPATIYYRVAVERISDGERSGWSNLVSVP